MASLYPNILDPRPVPRWKVARDELRAKQTHWEPSPGILEILGAWPRDLATVARERWDSIGRRPISYNSWVPSEGAPFWRANVDFWALYNEVRAARFDIGTDDAEICFLATRLANFIERTGQLQGVGMGSQLAKQYGIDPPHHKQLTGKVKAKVAMTAEGVFRRFCDPQWWRRKMRATFGQGIENTMRKRGLVCRTKAPYATDWCVSRRKSQKAALQNTLENATATSDEGEQMTLFELAKHSNSNPGIRRTELMVRSRGFEETAKSIQHTWTFATLTCPSAFHAVNYNKNTGTCYDNPRYEGASVRAGQAWHSKMWAKCRAKLKRIHVQMYGFRVVEPHHDGTPHWHLLLYCAPHNLETLKRVIVDYWLSEYGEELGANEHRVTFKDEDKNMPGSSATGYIAKYIAKNIDGFEVGTDNETGTDAADSAHRVEAWATCHRIRQFQQIGGPPVGLWREIRRLRQPVSDQTIEAARIHTEKETLSFSGFINAVGGIEAGRNTNVVISKETSLEPNRYGELRGPVVIGVESIKKRVLTRIKKWVVQWWSGSRARSGSGVFSDLGPVSITVRSENRGNAMSNDGCEGSESAPTVKTRGRGSTERSRRPPTRGNHPLHTDLPASIAIGSAQYWEWFRATGKNIREATRLNWLRN